MCSRGSIEGLVEGSYTAYICSPLCGSRQPVQPDGPGRAVQDASTQRAISKNALQFHTHTYEQCACTGLVCSPICLAHVSNSWHCQLPSTVALCGSGSGTERKSIFTENMIGFQEPPRYHTTYNKTGFSSTVGPVVAPGDLATVHHLGAFKFRGGATGRAHSNCMVDEPPASPRSSRSGLL